MSVVYERDGEFRVAVKGAPEAVLPLCRLRWDSAGPRQLSEADRQAALAPRRKWRTKACA